MDTSIMGGALSAPPEVPPGMRAREGGQAAAVRPAEGVGTPGADLADPAPGVQGRVRPGQAPHPMSDEALQRLRAAVLRHPSIASRRVRQLLARLAYVERRLSVVQADQLGLRLDPVAQLGVLVEDPRQIEYAVFQDGPAYVVNIRAKGRAASVGAETEGEARRRAAALLVWILSTDGPALEPGAT